MTSPPNQITKSMLPFRAEAITFRMQPATQINYDAVVLTPEGKKRIPMCVVAMAEEYCADPLADRLLELIRMYHTLEAELAPARTENERLRSELAEAKGLLISSEARVRELQRRAKLKNPETT
jgi:hypothetical protein